MTTSSAAWRSAVRRCQPHRRPIITVMDTGTPTMGRVTGVRIGDRVSTSVPDRASTAATATAASAARPYRTGWGPGRQGSPLVRAKKRKQFLQLFFPGLPAVLTQLKSLGVANPVRLRPVPFLQRPAPSVEDQRGPVG